jgi:purine-binding chemotaxis protein CheW
MSNSPRLAESKESDAIGAVRAGKYLTFRLAAEEYGLQILKVREIIGLMPITRMPEAPSYVRGIINLRGRVIPVLELRARFGMEPVADNEETCIIVVDMSSGDRSTLMGILVDAVSEVLDIKADEIQDSPAMGGDHECDFVLGIGKVKGGVKILLDIERVLNGTDMSSMNEGLQSTMAEVEMVV